MLAGSERAESSSGMKEHRGWFKVPGVQWGDRTLEEQVMGLDAVKGRSVLDIGCAEGLISRWLCGRGAKHADCVGRIVDELEAGRRLCAGYPIHFHCADLRKMEQVRGLRLRRQYDVVLLLSIVHKMLDPLPLLEWAAGKARHTIAVRVPARTYTDRGNPPQSHDIEAQLAPFGWTVEANPETCRGEWLGIFTRSR